MKKIAITGGICSGKSYICNLIEKLVYSVFYSDDVAMNLVNTHSPLNCTKGNIQNARRDKRKLCKKFFVMYKKDYELIKR